MTNKSKIYSIILLTTIIVMATVPNFLLDSIILNTPSNNDDEEEINIIDVIPSNNSFPSGAYITNVNFIDGTLEDGNLTSLKYNNDGKTYDLQGVIGIGKYDFNIEFGFDINLTYYTLDFYDLYLYLDIEVSFYPATVNFQVLSDGVWINVTEIANLGSNIDRYYAENTTKFRIYGSTSSQKVIQIDRICFLYAHQIYQTQYTGIKDDNPTYHREERPAWYCPNCVPYPAYLYPAYEHQDEWWKGLGAITQQNAYTMDFVGVYGYTQFECELELDIGDSPINHNETYIELFEIEVDVDHQHNGIDGGIHGWFRGKLWNYTADNGNGEWVLPIEDVYGYRKRFKTTLIYSWKNLNPIDFIDPVTNKTKFQFNTELFCDRRISQMRILFQRASIRIPYNYLTNSYPIIENIYTNPISPINTLELFELSADIVPQNPYLYNYSLNLIENAEYFIEGFSTQWLPMNHPTIDTWNIYLDARNFPNDNYTTWIRGTDNAGVSTMKPYIIEISNARPEITFNTPKTAFEKVDQLYDYIVNVTISDFEGDPYDDPEIKIDELFGDTLIDWTTMNRLDLLKPNEWTFSFDPIDFYNNLYTVWVRTSDEKQIPVSNNIVINIINNPPDIDIFEPSLSELITPMEQEIVCNISNEEAINSVQWDIVADLNSNFTWKNLTYTPATDLYNTTFSLLDYEYGDYYLVINATDDKYNSSIETKSIQFHPLIVYDYNNTEISYNSNGIKLYSNSQLTTAIVGSVVINHNIIVRERDFELYIPEEYDEANKYYINRGFEKYEPEGIFISGTYTLWNTPLFQPIDTVYFSLEKPKIINALIEEDDDDVLTMEFTISSKYAFTNIHVENQLAKYISDPENYDYTLYYMYEGEWKEMEDYEVEAKDFPEFTFTWSSIGEGMTISFRFKAEPLEEEETNLGSSILWGSVFLAIGVIITLLYGFGTSPRKYKEMGVLKYVLLSAGIIGGLFGVGFVIGLFV